MHELEVEVAQETQEAEIETVSINSVHLNINWSLITAYLGTQVGKSSVEIPYKIDTGNKGNIMPLYIFEKLFKDTTDEVLRKSIKSNIRLYTYNNTNITQLGMCVVLIKFKNVKKCCIFFVVPENEQALLGMPDTAVLNIININIDYIQAEMTECKTNIGWETHGIVKCCTNMDAVVINKQDANGLNNQNTSNKSIHYFYSSNNIDADKRKSSAMMQKIHEKFGNVFNGIGCFKGTFSLQLKPDSKPYHAPPRHVAYALQNMFKEELECLQKMDIITPLGVDEMGE